MGPQLQNTTDLPEAALSYVHYQVRKGWRRSGQAPGVRTALGAGLRTTPTGRTEGLPPGAGSGDPRPARRSSPRISFVALRPSIDCSQKQEADKPRRVESVRRAPPRLNTSAANAYALFCYVISRRFEKRAQRALLLPNVCAIGAHVARTICCAAPMSGQIVRCRTGWGCPFSQFVLSASRRQDCSLMARMHT